ncbi:MAG: DUF4129 domain-containing protein [Candidatus Eremiobacteraeota bacterium]|nr:DUF4129 domain-containing protein [Candidatus Eremiobacteraeota bacterium]
MSAQRDALIARWIAASHQSALRLEAPAPLSTPPPNLHALAATELTTPGRYRLTTALAPPSSPSIWLRLWSWLQDRFADLWRATYGRTHLGRGTAMAIGDVLIAAVALIVLFVAVRMLANLIVERRATRAEPLESQDDARALYASACERARAGDYGLASRLLFAATVATLANRGLVRDDRSATVGEFRRTLGNERSLVAAFDTVASAFVTSAYAEKPVEAPQWERARDAYLSLGGVVTA